MRLRSTLQVIAATAMLAAAVQDVSAAPTTRPTTAPAVAGDKKVTLTGTWICRPTVWESKARRLFVERSGVKPEQLDAQMAKYLTEMKRYRLVYTFAADGTGVRDYGFESGTPKAVPIKWQVAADARLLVGETVRIGVTLPDGKVETLPVTFAATDRFTVTVPGATQPIENPVTFIRAEVAPAVAGIAMPKPDAGRDELMASVKPLVPRVARELNKAFDNAADVEIDGLSITGTTFAAKSVNVSDNLTMARCELRCVEVLAPRGGRGDPIDLNSIVLFELRRDPTKWTCVRVTKTYVQEPGGRQRKPVMLTRNYRRFADIAQGLPVTVAQQATPDDVAAVPGPIDKDAEELIAAIRQRAERAMDADHIGMPEYGRASAGQGLVTKTRSGAVLLRFMITTTFSELDPERRGPAEFVDVRHSMIVLLKPNAQGKWTCMRAAMELDGMTGRNGPIDFRREGEVDYTADVQDWIDKKPDDMLPPPWVKVVPARKQ